MSEIRVRPEAGPFFGDYVAGDAATDDQGRSANRLGGGLRNVRVKSVVCLTPRCVPPVTRGARHE
jgi:hypothetical protein